MSSATPVDVFAASPFGSKIDAEQLEKQLADLPDWESRYQAVISLGEQSPQLDGADKVDAHLLHGCQAAVWVIYHYDTESSRLYFLADSDSRIVRGLLSCLLCLFNGQSPAAILAVDAKPWMQRVGLERHIASSRSNGLWAMMGKIKAIASRY